MNIITPNAPPAPAVRRLTKLEFQGRLGDPLFAAIVAKAKVDLTAEVWLRKFDMLTPEPDGTSISLDDPRTREGLMVLADMPDLAELGLTAELVDEILA